MKYDFVKAIRFFIYFTLSYSLFSCNQIDVFEKHTSIPNQKWDSNFSCGGSFEIKDTSSCYKISIVIRHTDAYKYNNIWLKLGLQMPGDTVNFQKINLALGDDANGWYGSGMGDIWELRKSLTKYPKQFNKPGVYKYSLSNIMRDNPLEHIMSVGIRIEKAK